MLVPHDMHSCQDLSTLALTWPRVFSLFRKLLLAAFHIRPVHESLVPRGLPLGCLTIGSRTSTARHPAVLQLRCMDGFAGYVYSRRKPIKVYVWHCSHCKEELDDGFLKMIACDHCLEWVCRTEQDITADDTACRGFQPLVPTSSRIYVARKTIHASHLKYCWMARRGARLPIVKHPRMDTPIHTRLLRQSSFPSRLSVLVHAVYLPSPLISTELPYSVLTRVLAKFHSIPTHSRKIDYLLIKISNNWNISCWYVSVCVIII